MVKSLGYHHQLSRTISYLGLGTSWELGVRFLFMNVPPLFFGCWVGWRLFFWFCLLYLLKWTPLKWWVLLSFFLIKKTYFCSCKIGWVFGGSSPKSPEFFFPKQPGDFVSRWRDLSKPSIGDPHLAIKWTNLWNILGDNRNCSSEKGWFAIPFKLKGNFPKRGIFL